MDLRSLLIRELTILSNELIREGLGEKTPGKYFSKFNQEVTLIAQNFRCNRCGKILGEYHFHHKDGDRSNNHISNCEALCLDCHAKETRRRAKNRRNFGSRVA